MVRRTPPSAAAHHEARDRSPLRGSPTVLDGRASELEPQTRNRNHEGERRGIELLYDVQAGGLRNVPYIHGSHPNPDSRWLSLADARRAAVADNEPLTLD